MLNFFITFNQHWVFSGIFSNHFPNKKDFLSSLNAILKDKKECYFPWNQCFFSIKPYAIGYFVFWRLRIYPQEVPYYHLHDLMMHYPWPGCITDEKGRLCHMNTPLGRILGYGSSDLQGRRLMDLFLTPPGPDHFPGKIYTLLGAQDTPIPMTVAHSIALGKHIGIFLFPANITHEGGGDLHWLCKLPIAGAVLDEKGTVQMMNGLLKTVLQGNEGANLSRWIAEKDRQHFSQELRRLRRLENPMGSMELSFLVPQQGDQAEKKPQTETWWSFLTFFPSVTSGPGKFLALFTLKDQPKKHENPSEPQEPEAQKMHLLGQVSSGIIHDFNNLLTGMLGFCDLLLQRHPQGDTSFKDIDQIRQSVLRAARLIQQLLSFSKSIPIAKHILCLKTCLTNLLPLLHRMLGPRVMLTFAEKEPQEETKIKNDKKIFSTWKNNPLSFTTFGDVGHLEQILLNLSINARDAMAQGGSLTFSLFHRWIKTPHHVIKNILKPGCYIVLEVQDTGTGISKDLIGRIFDPFFSTKGHKGTGIGLCNVLQLMDQWNGGLELHSTPNKGTTFLLYFPYEIHNGQNSETHLPTMPHLQNLQGSVVPCHDEKKIELETPEEKKTILLVEDEDPVRLFAARALKEKKYTVTEARDGQQALHLLKTKGPFSLIITDVMMPGMDGPTLVTHGRKMFPDIKILFVSGYPEEEVRTYLPKDMTHVFFLQKPFALEDLIKRVASL